MDRSISVQSVRFSYATLAKHTVVLQDELIYGGHLTAMGALAKIFFISALLGIWVGILPLIIAYTAILIVYSFDYHRSASKDMMTNRGRAAYFQGMSGTFSYRMLAYSAILAISLAAYANLRLIAVILAVAILGVAYSIFFKKVTRHIPGFKNVYTSGIWVAGTVLGVMACCPVPLNETVLLIAFFMFLRSLGNVIFFDLKDILTDGAEGLKTIPVLLGRKDTFILLGVLNVVSFLPLVTGVRAGVLPASALAMIAIAAITFYNMRQAWAKPGDYMSYARADAETLLWPIVLLIAGGILAL